MLLAQLIDLVEGVRATSRKTEKTSLLAEFLREARGRETYLATLYLTGTLPQGRLGVGWKLLKDVAQAGPAAPASPALSLPDVDRAFEGIAAERGPGSAERRQAILAALFGRAEGRERRFLTELVVGEIRQGALDGLVQEAIAKASRLPLADVRQAAMYSGDLGRVAQAALEKGAAGLVPFSLRLLSPVAPMLASPAQNVTAAIERLGEAAFEYKLDGARIQLHKAGDVVRIFTRHLQDVTARLPEIVESVRALPAAEMILEGEVIALRPDGRPQPFQVTMSRLGRSKHLLAARQRLPVTPFYFDCLYAEGEGPVVALSYAQRFERLRRLVPTSSLLPRIVTGAAAEAERFFAEALAAGHEGLMAKSLTGAYAAGQRGFHWLKLKSALTLDLVVLAAEWGSGRRKGWLSNLHLGARDEQGRGFVMLGKTFKGLTDEMLRWQTERLLSLQVARDEWTVHVRPELVVEVAFNDVQESHRYPAGLALRFARVKGHRPDKVAQQADTLQTVAEIFRRQRT